MPNSKSTTNGKGNSSPLAWRKNTGPAVECLYAEVSSEKLRDTIDAIARAGGAVMFGTTSDRGAFSVCVLYEGDKVKEYPHGALEMHELLDNLTANFSDI